MTMRTWAAVPLAIIFLLGIARYAAADPPRQAKRSVVVRPEVRRVPVVEPTVQLVQADGDLLPIPTPVDTPELKPADELKPAGEADGTDEAEKAGEDGEAERAGEVDEADKVAPAEPLQPANQLPRANPIRPANPGGAAALLPPPRGLGPAAEEVAAQADEGPISNVFVDSDLRQALQDIALQAQVTIVAGPEVTGLVTAELNGMHLDEALQVLLAGTGYLVEQTPRYYLVYSPDPSNPALREISRTRRVKLEYLKADQAMKLLPPYYRDFSSAGEGTNVIAISAPPQIIEEIRTVIAEIDQPQRHVLLQSRVVVLDEIDLMNEGTQWGFPKLHLGGVVDDTLSGFGMRVGYTLDRQFTNELLVALNLLQRNDRAQILSEPVVMAQDGQSSKISVTRQEYFRIIAQGYYVQTNIEEIETGTILEITPQIGDNNEITLHLDIEVSDVTARGEDNLPVVDRRQAHNVIRLKDGGTAAIAGLMVSEDQKSHQMVPWFGRLPVLGKVFHNYSNESARKQVAVFITATLVDDPNGMPLPGPPGLVPGSPFDSISMPAPVDEEEFREALKESLARQPRRGPGKTHKH